MKKTRRILAALLAVVLMLSLVACSGDDKDPKPSDTTSPGSSDTGATGEQSPAGGDDNSADVRKITIAFSQGNKPYAWTTDDGQLDGYEIKAMQLVDEMLPQYEFEFVQTAFDDMSTGVTTGKYQVGLSSSFKTAAREEQMLFPSESIGASGIGMIVRKEDAECDTMRKCVDKGLTMTAIAPSDGMWVIVDNYNKENPDAPLLAESAEIYSLADFYIYVAEKRFDYTLINAAIWDTIIADPDSDMHYLEELLVQHEICAVPTWTLMNKEEVELAEAVGNCLKELKENGTLADLMVEYLGRNYFEIVVE